MRKGDFVQVAKQYASEYPEVEGTRCVSVHIPDDDKYLPVLAAMVASLGNTWSSRGTVSDRRLWAEMWQKAYAATDWEGCMSCDDVADCIDSSEVVQIAINNVTQQQQNGQNPIAPSVANANLLGGLPSCDLNALWGAQIQFVEWLNDNNTDFLDRLTSASTPAKRSAVMSQMIPGFNAGALGEALSAAITFLSSQLKGEYEEGYDQIYENGLACEFFCLAQEDCELSMVHLYQVLSARVGFTPAADAFYEGLIFAVFGEWTGSQFADVMMFIQVGAFLFMGGFAGYLGVNPLANAMSNGFDQPDDDWQDECDCPELWTYQFDSASLPVWVTFPDPFWGEIDGVTITPTTRVAFSQDVTGVYIEVVFPTVQTLANIAINQLSGVNIAGSTVVNTFYTYLDAGDNPINPFPNGIPYQNGEFAFAMGETVVGVKKVVIQYLFIGTTQDFEWNVWLSGRGTNPFL